MLCRTQIVQCPEIYDTVVLDQIYRRKPVLWSRSYCIISCAGAPLSVIKQYIEQQAAPE
jgi:REP element-mobilizing transposase RayT